MTRFAIALLLLTALVGCQKSRFQLLQEYEAEQQYLQIIAKDLAGVSYIADGPQPGKDPGPGDKELYEHCVKRQKELQEKYNYQKVKIERARDAIGRIDP